LRDLKGKVLRVLARGGAHEIEMPPDDVQRDIDRKHFEGPRIPREHALTIAAHVALELAPLSQRFAYAGSLRRGNDDVGDIDILIVPKDDSVFDWLERFLWDERGVPRPYNVLVSGPRKVMLALEGGERVDIIATRHSEWGAALQYLTGSRWHNISLRQRARDRGLKLNEHGVFRVDDGTKLAGDSEGGIYAALGLRWVPPECRQNPIGKRWERE
jgi:DNA polymerase (family 10)